MNKSKIVLSALLAMTLCGTIYASFFEFNGNAQGLWARWDKDESWNNSSYTLYQEPGKDPILIQGDDNWSPTSTTAQEEKVPGYSIITRYDYESSTYSCWYYWGSWS